MLLKLKVFAQHPQWRGKCLNFFMHQTNLTIAGEIKRRIFCVELQFIVLPNS